MIEKNKRCGDLKRMYAFLVKLLAVFLKRTQTVLRLIIHLISDLLDMDA